MDSTQDRKHSHLVGEKLSFHLFLRALRSYQLQYYLCTDNLMRLMATEQVARVDEVCLPDLPPTPATMYRPFLLEAFWLFVNKRNFKKVFFHFLVGVLVSF